MRYLARFTYDNGRAHRDIVKSLNNSSLQRRFSSHFHNDYEFCHPFNYTSILSLIMIDNVRQVNKYDLTEESEMIYSEVILHCNTLEMRISII